MRGRLESPMRGKADRSTRPYFCWRGHRAPAHEERGTADTAGLSNGAAVLARE